MSKCSATLIRYKPVAKKIVLISKLALGVTGIFVILALIFGPMILFSSLNPISQNNLVTGAKV